MRTRSSPRVPGRAFVWAALGLALGSCAPHLVRPPELSLESRETRYLGSLSGREKAAAAVEADLVAWVVLADDRDLPGAQARLLLAAPDAFRLRVQSPFGTALDLAGRGDSLTAYVPPRRAGMALANSGDSLGLREPARFLVRGFAALWRPPPDAWRTAVWRDTLLETQWSEGEDSLVVWVGSSGLPARASVSRDGRGVRVRYDAWDASRGAAWPSRLAIEDLEGRGRVTCVVRNLRFTAAPDLARFSLHIPADASHVTLADLRRTLERLSAF